MKNLLDSRADEGKRDDDDDEDDGRTLPTAQQTETQATQREGRRRKKRKTKTPVSVLMRLAPPTIYAQGVVDRFCLCSEYSIGPRRAVSVYMERSEHLLLLHLLLRVAFGVGGKKTSYQLDAEEPAGTADSE